MNPFRWERRKDDLHEEVGSHLRMAIADRVARGEDPKQAREAALREMGNLPLIADVTRHQWGFSWLDRAAQDIRYALRQLRRSPGYTITALLTLMLTLGANTAIFGLLYALLLRSLPVEHPENIIRFSLQRSTKGHAEEPSENTSTGIYGVISNAHQSLIGLCGWQEQNMNLQAAEGTAPIQAVGVNGGCMPMLGLHAEVGRLITSMDDHTDNYPIVLSYNYWISNYGGDPEVLGRPLKFSASFRTGNVQGVIVGVMEQGFRDVQVGGGPDLFVTLAMTNPRGIDDFGSGDTLVLGRLREGVKPEAALAEADTLLQGRLKSDKNLHFYTFLKGEFGEADAVHLLVQSGRTGYSYLRSDFKAPLYLIEGMVGLSLLVACAYLAMLASTRALARRRELAVRMALGASRSRIAAQLTWESILLVIAGSTLGCLFAWVAQRALTALISGMAYQPIELNTTPGAAVLAFTTALMTFVVIISGLWPAWRASKVDPIADIKEGNASTFGRRAPVMGKLLVPAQIAFSLVIVTIAALMGTTVARLLAVNPGFSTSGITFLEADFASRTQKYKYDKAPEMLIPLLTSLLDRIRATPGIEGVSISQAYPLEGGSYLTRASSQPHTGPTRTNSQITSLSISPSYIQTMSIPLFAGRDFAFTDQGSAEPVCILNRSAADYFFPGENSVGNTIISSDKVHLRVVGVVADTLYLDLRSKAPVIVYEPFFQRPLWNPNIKFEIHAHSSGTAVTAVRSAFHELAFDIPVDKPVTVQRLVNRTMGRERMVAYLSGFFAILTLALTGIGLYGVMNNSVLCRRPEIGIRIALGSTPGGVIQMILSESLRLVLPGLILGAAGVWAVTRLLKSLLFGVKALDPTICAISFAVLAAVAIIATAMPARKAAMVDPAEILRLE